MDILGTSEHVLECKVHKVNNSASSLSISARKKSCCGLLFRHLKKMAPKRGARSSSCKKDVSTKEKKKQVAPLTKETGGSTTKFLWKKQKSTMSAAQVACLVVQSPTTSDVGSSQESSITQSTQVVTHLTSTIQQPKPQQQLHGLVVQAQVHAQGAVREGALREGAVREGAVREGAGREGAGREGEGREGEGREGEVHGELQVEVSEEAHVAVQVPTMVVLPEVGAQEEIDFGAGVSCQEDEATPPDDSFSPSSPARKRSMRVCRSSSSSPAPSDDLDVDWQPSPTSEREAHHELRKVSNVKRKGPGKLILMDPNVGLDEVVHSDVVEQDDSNDLVITHVIPATPAMQQTDIYTLSRRHAERDPGDVALVAPPTCHTFPPYLLFTKRNVLIHKMFLLLCQLSKCRIF
ncbi:uncharacterized protein LOC144755898 isoform X2 [Lissotriton helveticus]